MQTGPINEFAPFSFTSDDDGDVMVFIRYVFMLTTTGKDVAMTCITTGRSAAGRRASAAPRTRRNAPRL